MGNYKKPFPLTKKDKKRKHELYIILSTFLLLLIFIFLEVFVIGYKGSLPFTHNILVHGLININLFLLLLLMFLVIRNLVKLFFERKRGILGSKLRTKLVASFVALTLIPTLLLFGMAVGFISITIENWFSFQVENSLKESLSIAQNYYKTAEDNSLYYARQLSEIIMEKKLLNEQNLSFLREFVVQKQKEYNLGIVEVYSAQMEKLVSARNTSIPAKIEIQTAPELLKDGLSGKSVAKIRPIDKGDLVQGIVPVYSTFNKRDVVGILIVNYYIPRSLVGKMQQISKAFSEYKLLMLAKNPIKITYIMTFTVITLLIIFCATWFGLHLAREMTVPIRELASGTKAVAQGNLDFKIEAVADDEIGSLVTSFNQMTQELKNNKSEIEETNVYLQKANIELEQRRKYIETILKNVAAGVISIDQTGKMATINNSAQDMLKIKTEECLGKNYRDVLTAKDFIEFQKLIEDLINLECFNLEREINLTIDNNNLILLAKASALLDEKGSYLGLVIVFEDLTELQKAQRVAAWREVARRIAHEIKNPLTPIQLSAQRLKRKFNKKSLKDIKVFEECIGVITSQVEAIKEMVNEFSNFARMPTSRPTQSDLNQIIQEALFLFQENHKNIRFTFTNDPDVPIINLDGAQIKRVFINLLDNAVYAVNGKIGEISIKTEYNEVLNIVQIEVVDNGCGIQKQAKDRLFEPYFSTKTNGTGLGLTIVKSIISDHNGFIRVKDNSLRGTRFIIELPVISS
ncbi:MAG: ATP-binding protein [Thermodesulfobacteriota bacterium]|nr:ATP-binding protein [Thermodesulfobacteriota bacterium]